MKVGHGLQPTDSKIMPSGMFMTSVIGISAFSQAELWYHRISGEGADPCTLMDMLLAYGRSGNNCAKLKTENHPIRGFGGGAAPHPQPHPAVGFWTLKPLSTHRHHRSRQLEN